MVHINYDPTEPETYKRLRKAMRVNYDALEGFRRVRRLIIDATAGHYYDTNDEHPEYKRDPVNMLDQWLQALVRSFIQNNPRTRINNRNNPQSAAVFQEVVNRRIKEMNLVTVLRRIATESLQGYLGVAYCGIGPSETDPAGEPFVDSVSLPDFVVDLAHDEFEQADIIGHRFSRRIVDLEADPGFDQDMVAKLKPDTTSGNTELQDDIDHDDEHDEIERGEGSIFDWVNLWSIHIKPANMTVVMSEQSEIDRPLRIASYDGPEFGPYVTLGFTRVLDKLMPNSPAALLFDLHDFTNSQYRRIMDRENRQADFWTYEGGAEDDARRIDNARDGDMIKIESNAAVQRRIRPGTNPNSIATAIHSRSLFDDASGNIRQIGGVSSSADTATEARIDSANVSRMVRDMQLQVVEMTRKIVQIIAWYEWTHPLRTENIEIKIGENGLAVESLWSPEMREGDFIEHELEIIPDSMEHRSSRQQAEEIMRLMQGAVLPAMQLPSDRPVTFDGVGFVKTVSDLLNIPEAGKFTNYAQDDNFQSQPANIPNTPNAQAQERPSLGNQGNDDDALVQQLLTTPTQGGEGQ